MTTLHVLPAETPTSIPRHMVDRHGEDHMTAFGAAPSSLMAIHNRVHAEVAVELLRHMHDEPLVTEQGVRLPVDVHTIHAHLRDEHPDMPDYNRSNPLFNHQRDHSHRLLPHIHLGNAQRIADPVRFMYVVVNVERKDPT